MAESQPNTASVPPQQSSTQTQTGPASTAVPINAAYRAATSLDDTGLSARPRDARTIHMVLASLGVSAYQERVPLQLLDFAYRYTSSILADAQHLSAEGYVAPTSGTTGGGGGGKKGAAGAAGAESDISLAALRLATASRNAYSYASGGLPKQTLLEMAQERNKIRLPEVDKEVYFGVRLPHERYVQTGTGWGMMEEWDSEVEEDDDMVEGHQGEARTGNEGSVDGVQEGQPREEAEDEDMEDGDDGFEQVFGEKEDAAMEEE